MDRKLQHESLSNLVRQSFDQRVFISGPYGNHPSDDPCVIHGFGEAVGMNGVLDRTGDFEVSQERLRALSFVKRNPALCLKTYFFNDDGFGHTGIVGKGKKRVKSGCTVPLRPGVRRPDPLDPLFGGLL